MRRVGRPALSPSGQQVLDQYERQLRMEEDLATATIRNYLAPNARTCHQVQSKPSFGLKNFSAASFRPSF